MDGRMCEKIHTLWTFLSTALAATVNQTETWTNEGHSKN